MSPFLRAVESRIVAEREAYMSAVKLTPTHKEGGRPRVPDARIIAVKQLRADGVMPKSIGQRLGLTVGQVKWILRQPNPRPSARLTADERRERNAEILAMTREGKTARTIAESVGVTIRTVVRVRSRGQP